MSANEDQKLEAMLRQRHVEPVSPDLAARILLKAQSLPQVRNITCRNRATFLPAL
jgi:hypothetical protein